MQMHEVRRLVVLGQAKRVPQAGRPSASRQRLRGEAIELARREALVDAAYSYAVVALDAPPAALLRAGGEHLHAPWLLPASGRLTAIACCACTLGPGLERRVNALFVERRASLAMALDELGNELLFVVSRRAQDRMQANVARRGLCMAGELRAGDPGLALDAQPAVLRLARAGAIGITLSSGQVMHPLKSTSMVLGVGIDLPAVQWSRCDPCPNRDRCAVARRAKSSMTSSAAA